MIKKPEGRLESYELQTKKCREFLLQFQDTMQESDDPSYAQYGRLKYLIQLQKIANDELKVLEILVEDLREYFGRQDEKILVQSFVENTNRYITIFTDVANELLPQRNTQLKPQQYLRNKFENVLLTQRQDNIDSQEQRGRTENQRLPTQVTRKFDVIIAYGPNAKHQIYSIRQLKAELIGSLITCKAIVVRASEVKPRMITATYTCDACGSQNYQNVYGRDFTPLTDCMSKRCKENKMNGKLTFISGSSKFVAFQELKIQQISDQLIEGNIPRTFFVYLYGTAVKTASPGDIVLIQGILLPNRRQGFRHRGEITFDSYIEGYKITREKKKYMDMTITNQTKQKIEKIRHEQTDEDLYNKLAKSIAPQIYGLENVKKALLLLMVGGITKETHDNMRIRGQINIALIGDPGIAKSQLLKHIAYVSPRGVYTTGKGSSGVGLTAAIVKDPITNEVTLEAGALVLADMGVCCIDQFDKMDEYDRTAIHEVMQQQTVSIAKAGITTSLNARTSILAAANPLYGRYNRKQTPHKNINLPAALLSRFDLIFVLLDTADKARDFQLAKHIGNVHKNKKSPTIDVFDAELLRSYIAMAKSYNPTINEQLYNQLTKKYIQKRKQQMDLNKQGYNYTTTRTLLGLIRLCQARARLRFSNEVNSEDVQESLQLIQESQKNIQLQSNTRKPRTDNISAIFSIIKDICLYDSITKKSSLDLIQKRILARGYNLKQLQQTIETYQKTNVLMRQTNFIRLVE